MRTARRTCGWLLALLLAGAAQRAEAQTAAAQAQPPAAASAERAGLTAERARVRADLDRVNAEVDALKRGKRGMREDYLLRARLADAEAMARRLTEIDARLGTPAAPAATPSMLPSADPIWLPTDGPAEMDAKADILADRARRVASQADALRTRGQQLKARQELRRHVGQMEHDPFSPLEGAKRRVAAAPGEAPLNSSSSGGTFTGTTAGDRAPTPPAGATPTGGGSAPSTLTPGGRGVVGQPAPPSPIAGTGGEGTALSVQLRDLLDPDTLAEIRKLEASRAPGASAEAMERAAAALRARAAKLQEQSQALRTRAHGARDPR
jgi:hypothetical protein